MSQQRRADESQEDRDRVGVIAAKQALDALLPFVAVLLREYVTIYARSWRYYFRAVAPPKRFFSRPPNYVGKFDVSDEQRRVSAFNSLLDRAWGSYQELMVLHFEHTWMRERDRRRAIRKSEPSAQ